MANEEELSAEEEQKLWGFVEKYLEEVAPIHWLNWHGRCQDEDARMRVSTVLFHNGHLRHLTHAAVKQEVLEAIRHEPAMMQLVVADLAEEVAKHERKNPGAESRVEPGSLDASMSEWKLHIPTDDNRTTHYKCGLVAGQHVRLKKDLVVRAHDGVPTGTVHRAGEEWVVLAGITTDPVLWFRQADGERCTWDDDAASVEEWFVRV